MTMSYLLVSNEDPVVLDGYLDSSSNLQLKHDSDELDDYDQEIWCSHDTATAITVEIHDFVVGATTWTVSAEHDRSSWTRESDHVWFTFTEEPSWPLEVQVSATDGAGNKQRTIYIKPQPQPPNLLQQSSAEQLL